MSIKSNKNKNFKTYLTILYNYSKESNINKNSFLIVGEPPQIIYPNIFKMENYKEINNYKVENEYLNFFSKVSQYISWSIEINKISFNNRNINNNSYIGVFSLDYIPFLLPIELFNAYIDTYLMTYINKNICYKKVGLYLGNIHILCIMIKDKFLYLSIVKKTIFKILQNFIILCLF